MTTGIVSEINTATRCEVTEREWEDLNPEDSKCKGSDAQRQCGDQKKDWDVRRQDVCKESQEPLNCQVKRCGASY